MPVTILKTKGKAKAKASTNVIDEVVQEFVARKLELDAKLAKLADLQKQVEAGEKELLSYVDLLVGPAETTELQAGEYVVKVGAKGAKAVSFDKDQIKKVLGAKLFNDLSQFSVTDLKKYMTGEEFSAAVGYENVNKRRVVIEKAVQV